MPAEEIEDALRRTDITNEVKIWRKYCHSHAKGQDFLVLIVLSHWHAMLQTLEMA